MIKVNLLTEANQKAKGAKSGPRFNFESSANTTNLMMVGTLALALLVAGGLWWTTNSELKDWEQKHRDADAEIERLKPILKQADQYEKRKELLTRKIDLITDLKRKQSVPVHILDQMSRNLPEFLWLNSMNSNDNKIDVKGKATTYNAVSNFYNNLAASGYFANVTLGKTSEAKDGVTFSLTCVFAPDADAPPQELLDS